MLIRQNPYFEPIQILHRSTRYDEKFRSSRLRLNFKFISFTFSMAFVDPSGLDRIFAYLEPLGGEGDKCARILNSGGARGRPLALQGRLPLYAGCCSFLGVTGLLPPTYRGRSTQRPQCVLACCPKMTEI